jgi:hypothetical protein
MRHTCEKCKKDYGYIGNIKIKCECEKEHEQFLIELHKLSNLTTKES